MARCGCGGSCSCNLAAGEGVVVAGTGSALDPWVVSAEIASCAEVRTCIDDGNGTTYNPATGIMAVCLSGAAGNTLSFVTGCLYNTNTVGCGITGNGTVGSPLAANVTAWPYACAIATNAGAVSCDGATGKLWGEPRTKVQFSTITLEQNFADLAVPAGAPSVIATLAANFTNPDNCRAAKAIAFQEMEFQLTLPTTASAEYGYTGDTSVGHQNGGTTTETGFHVQTSKVTDRGTIAAGATVNYGFDALLGNGTGGATYSRVQMFLSMLFIST